MQERFSDDPYHILEISPSASAAEIKRAYFKLVREHSPEKDPEGFKRIRNAYDKLRFSDTRTKTDFTIFTVDTTNFAPPTIELRAQDMVNDLMDLELCYALQALAELKSSS